MTTEKEQELVEKIISCATANKEATVRGHVSELIGQREWLKKKFFDTAIHNHKEEQFFLACKSVAMSLYCVSDLEDRRTMGSAQVRRLVAWAMVNCTSWTLMRIYSRLWHGRSREGHSSVVYGIRDVETKLGISKEDVVRCYKFIGELSDMGWSVTPIMEKFYYHVSRGKLAGKEIQVSPDGTTIIFKKEEE